jgi:DNA helicase IV
MKLADRVSGLAASATCVRSSGHAPRFVAIDERLDALAGLVAEEVAEADGGKVAVIADRELVAAIERALAIERSDDPLDGAVAVLDAEGAKGLEFDSVIVVEPARLDRASLYVALTRTTTRLAVVHAEPLPAAFATSGTTR